MEPGLERIEGVGLGKMVSLEFIKINELMLKLDRRLMYEPLYWCSWKIMG